MIAHEFFIFKDDPAKRQRGVNYTFDQDGDAIPVHTHSFAHVSFAIAGDFEVSDGAGKVVDLKEGQRIVFPSGQPHGVKSRGIGNKLMNLNEAGQ